MYKWKVTIHLESSRNVLKKVEVLAEELIDVSRILMTFNATKGSVIYKYEIEQCETLV